MAYVRRERKIPSVRCIRSIYHFFFFLNLYIFEFYQTRKFDTKREILSLSTRERYINDKYEEALARRSFIINK